MIPAVWAFMKRRRTKDYLRLLQSLSSSALEIGYTLKPIQVMIDFEIAAKEAFENLFPRIIVKGCIFHFSQSLFKRFCTLGLKTDYLEKAEVHKWFKAVFCLALIPINNIEQEFEMLSNEMRQVVSRSLSIRSRGKDFLTYVENTYLKENCRFPKEMWNHFDNHHERTNNRVEGDNNKMKLFCGAADPKIDKAVALLQQYESTASDKYENAKKEDARAPPVKPDVAIREANFRQARHFFGDNKLSYNDYKLTIRDLFKFEPKKKYVEELEDTGESDATSISENSEEEIDEIEEHDQLDEQVESNNQEENYLPSFEDNELNLISNRLNNSKLNDTQPAYHLMEPR